MQASWSNRVQRRATPPRACVRTSANASSRAASGKRDLLGTFEGFVSHARAMLRPRRRSPRCSAYPSGRSTGACAMTGSASSSSSMRHACRWRSSISRIRAFRSTRSGEESDSRTPRISARPSNAGRGARLQRSVGGRDVLLPQWARDEWVMCGVS